MVCLYIIDLAHNEKTNILIHFRYVILPPDQKKNVQPAFLEAKTVKQARLGVNSLYSGRF